MYADPAHIRLHRVNLSLNGVHKRMLEAAAEFNGMQPSVYALELVLAGLASVRHEADSAHDATKMLATQ